MSTDSLTAPLLGIGRLWSSLPNAWFRRSPLHPSIELSDRTLDDIGAPDWLRAQAQAARDDGAALFTGRGWW